MAYHLILQNFTMMTSAFRLLMSNSGAQRLKRKPANRLMVYLAHGRAN
jgi:hypothetical protein